MRVYDYVQSSLPYTAYFLTGWRDNIDSYTIYIL